MSLFSNFISKNWKDIGAFVAGGAGGLLGYEKIKSIGAQGKRTKDYLNDAYTTAQQRMKTSEAAGAESNLEALNSRGMLGAGVGPIRAALLNGQTQGATDLAGASRSRLAGEFALDRHALDAEHQKDLNENKANTTNAYIDFGKQAISTAASVFGDAQGLAGTAGAGAAAPSANMTPIRSALLSGSSFDNIHPVDPLNDASSSWHTPHISINGSGMLNSDFNTSGVG